MSYYTFQKLRDKLDKIAGIIFYIAAMLMIINFSVCSNGWVAITCLWLFIIYFAWYDIYAKNKNVAIIPLWLYVIGYHVIYRDSILNLLQFFKDMLLGRL